MDCPFENLGPDRFQQFCQTILTKQFPNLICFPIRQADGGRDAVVYVDDLSTRKFAVFQVKFALKPQAEEDPHKWLIETVSAEAPKVKELIPKGASKYYLLTNIPGTAHPDSGSIDKVKEILSREIPVPAECWWRDDLARRLEAAPEIRWAYPELLTGLDILASLIESGLLEHKQRRAQIIKAFLRDQYETEKEVRFKQVELQNRLLDLFIDVPVALRDVGTTKSRYLLHNVLQKVALEYYEVEDVEPGFQRTFHDRDDRTYTGAASFFLHPLAQEHFPAVVLEGAPGQGKSTITQYVCQVHRMRLLNEIRDIDEVPEQHKTSPIRLPIRVDLRDLATWLTKKNPFSADENDAPPPTWYKSLDSFLAALVSHHSGGGEFTISDLHAVMSLSAVLLIFDGLDEVADITKRQEVVDEITRGISRLREAAASLQVIITSRPAAFANSPGFSTKSFPHCQLESLTRPLILQYAEQWLQARKLNTREGAEVRKILKEKLDQPHLRDLAKNPMQLAILLSLIHSRGSSLPDKRTELYDNYVELFFSREAQKSSVVRENRDLLINIHRYLAWVLQSEAEEGKHRGSINAEKLQRLLLDYLTREGYDTSLVQNLFTGMVERVVALVSRVEGTYEFEVQPLREYFAARYLYVTAPYSPPGSPKRGNILDRFNAIAKDFYWLNVTRFYSGCFDIGELPSLSDCLEELTKEDGYRQTNHPHYLAATLLADWVFAQHPKSMNHVVSIMIGGLGLRLLLASSNRRYRRSGTLLVLPKQCGRDDLITQCFAILRANPAPDYASEVIELIKINADPPEISAMWLDNLKRTTGKDRTTWIRYGLLLGALALQAQDELESIVEDIANDPVRLALIYRARRLEFIENSEARSNTIISLILDGAFPAFPVRKAESTIDLFTQSLDASRYALSFSTRDPRPLCEIWDASRRFTGLAQEIQIKSHHPIFERCQRVIDVAIQESSRTSEEWASEITPWDNLVEQIRKTFGEQWICVHLANIGSGIRSLKETCTDHPELLDTTTSLCRRVRYARLRSGQTKWWERQLQLTEGDLNVALICLVLITWGKSHTLTELAGRLNDALEKLPSELWAKIIHSARQCLNLLGEYQREGQLSLNVEELPKPLSPRCIAAFGLRAKTEAACALYLQYLNDYEDNDREVWAFCQRTAMSLLRKDPKNWSIYLRTIEQSYAMGQVSEHPYRDFMMPLEAAKTIAEHPERYPGFLVTLAEAVCRKDIASRITPVGVVARKDMWFS